MTEIARLSHRALIRITGPDWATFLKGLCTAHIDRITAEVADGRFDTLHYGAFLRPQGKMYADCLLMTKGPEDIWLDVPEAARAELLSRLNMYKLRAQVAIEALDLPVFVAFGGGLPDGFADDPRSVIAGATFGFAYDDREATITPVDWAVFRIGLGIAEAGQDFGPDELYAIDANLDLLDAIDFHKGCYVGQELTSRMKRRGQIKNRLLPLNSEGDLEKGAEILIGDRKVGEVTSAYGRIGMGLMRLDRLKTRHVQSSGHAVFVGLPSWVKQHVQLGSDAPA